MSVKINGKELHLTTFEVPTSGKNIRRCLEAQKNFAKANMVIENVDEEKPESILESLDAQMNLIDTYTEFLKPVLKLSDAQVEKIEDADFDKVVTFTNKVISKILDVDQSKSDD